MDCFVALLLAMTIERQYKKTPVKYGFLHFVRQ